MKRVVVITRDLMDASRVQAAVPATAVVGDIDAPEVEKADLIALDLDTGIDPATAVAVGPPVMAYGPHVDHAALERARSSGCVDVLPRSAFFKRFASLVEEPARRSLPEVLDLIGSVEGWLTDAQAQRLHELAAALDASATIVEIGSFRGRSTIVLAASVPDTVAVVAIDPHTGGDRGPREIRSDPARGDADFTTFHANLEAAGVADRVRHVRRYSYEATSDVTGDIDLLFIDGAHRIGPARDDIVRWGARVQPGGAMAVHDAFSSIGVTVALLSTTVAGSRWRYRGRTGSLAQFERAGLGGRERVANGARQLAELPWFLRNLVIKVLIVARLRRLARLLGHPSGHWPY